MIRHQNGKMENGFPRGFVNHSCYSVLPTQSAWPANAVVFFSGSRFLTLYRKVTTGRSDNRKYVFLYSLTVVRFLTINNRNRFFLY